LSEKRYIFALLILGVFSLLASVSCQTYDEENLPGDYSAPDGDNDAYEDSDGDSEQSEQVQEEFPPGPYGLAIGDVMESWQLSDCEGNTVALKDYYPDAKAVLINSSAGWCTFCRRETPKLQEWYEEYSGDGLVILQALFENNAGKPADSLFCRSWREEYGLTYPVLVDPEKIFSDYYLVPGETAGTPLSVILDSEMVISLKHEGDISNSILERIVEILEQK